MSEPTVRECTVDDEVEAGEVDRVATEDLRKVYRPTPLALAGRASLAQGLTRLVAVVAGRVVGVVQYRIEGDRLAFLGLGVHPGFRRCGVARALVRHLESVARERGCAIVSLRTVRQTGNVAIFERLGFRVESEAPTALFESDTFSSLLEVVMTKRQRYLPAGQGNPWSDLERSRS